MKLETKLWLIRDKIVKEIEAIDTVLEIARRANLIEPPSKLAMELASPGETLPPFANLVTSETPTPRDLEWANQIIKDRLQDATQPADGDCPIAVKSNLPPIPSTLP